MKIDRSAIHIEDYGTPTGLRFALNQPDRVTALIVWGRNDPIFTMAGAEAFKRDLPKAELHYLDAGHFATETHSAEIAGHIRAFLGRVAK